MKDVYAVLRQKELEVSRLEEEVEALRVVAPLLSEDGEAENDNQPTLPRAVNDTPQPDNSGWQDEPKSAGCKSDSQTITSCSPNFRHSYSPDRWHSRPCRCRADLCPSSFWVPICMESRVIDYK